MTLEYNDVVSIIEDIICDVMEFTKDQIHPNHSFKEMDLDSLAVVEIVEAIEERLGITLDDQDLDPDSLANLHDLYDLVWSRVQQKED